MIPPSSAALGTAMVRTAIYHMFTQNESRLVRGSSLAAAAA